jgi:hypothetical protein
VSSSPFRLPGEHQAPLHPGGVMRCCLETWRVLAPAEKDSVEGQVLRCTRCGDALVFVGGVWCWEDGVTPSQERE